LKKVFWIFKNFEWPKALLSAGKIFKKAEKVFLTVLVKENLFSLSYAASFARNFVSGHSKFLKGGYGGKLLSRSFPPTASPRFSRSTGP